MATLSVSGNSGSATSIVWKNFDYSVVITYSVSHTNTQTTLTISNVTHYYRKYNSATQIYTYGLYILTCGATVAGKYTRLYNYFAETDSGTSLPVTKTWNKTTSAQTIQLSLAFMDCGTNGDPSTVVAGNSVNITSPALTSYTVSYNANSHGTAPASQTKWYGVALTLASAITADGYSFKRWNTNSTDTGTAYSAGSSYTGNAALTLYAIWNRTISYNANGGAGAPSSQTAVATSAITITSAVPTHEGYAFVDWTTNADGTGDHYTSGSSYAVQQPNITLYAQWKKVISSITIGSATAIRVDSNTSTTESDDGEFAYIEVPYVVQGLAAGTITMSVTGTTDYGDEPPITLVDYTAQKLEDSSLTGTFIARASECDVAYRYLFTITITGVNTTAQQTDVVVTRTLILPIAFFTLDFLAGGRGVHFGAPSVEEGFWVSMQAHFNDTVKIHSKNLWIKDETITVDDIPSVSKYNYGVYFSDSMDTKIGYVRDFYLSNDNVGVQLEAYRYTGSDVYNGLFLGIASDGTRYVSVSDPTKWRAALDVYSKSESDSRYVNITGDTMTGTLSISTSSGAASILKNTATAADGSTVTSQVPMAYRWTQDKNGYTCFYTETQKQTTGQIYQSFVVRNKINGTDYQNGFYLYVSNTGVPAVGFSNNTVRDAWATGLNVVKKAGDTMTGVLTISVARNTSYRIKFTDIDARIGQTAPSSNIYWDKSYVLDKNDRLMHYEEGSWGTNNNFSFTYGLRRYSANGSSSYTNYFNLGIDNSGNGSVSVSHPAAWRTAIGCAPSGYVKPWTLIAETSGTTAKSYSSIAGYTEACIMAWYTTTYLSYCVVPLNSLTLTTEWELYLGGGRNGTGTSQRRAVCKFSGTKITPYQITVDANVVNGNWRVYVR